MEANRFTLPLQDLGCTIYSFSLAFTDKSGAPELAIQATANITLWGHQLGHLNRKSLDVVKMMDNDEASFKSTIPDCDVSAVGPITSEVLGDYKYVGNISDEQTKWTEIHMLTPKGDALSSFRSFVQSVMIPSDFRVERLRADKSGEYISKKYKDCGL